MNDDFSSESPSFPGGFKMDAFIPLVLLSISVIVLLGWQVSVNSTQRGELENAITRQEPAVTQSQQVQAGVSKLVGDLLAAAQTDDAAKAIVAKFKIEQNGAAGAAAGSASPAP
jgi:hypothetical protein